MLTAIAIGSGILLFLLLHYLMLGIIRINNRYNQIRERNSAMSFMESVNLTNLPVITFEADTIDGDRVKLNFILDSGSDQSMMDLHSLLNLNILNRIKDKTATASSIEGVNKEKLLCGEVTLYYKDKEFTEEFALKNMSESFNLIKQRDGVTVHGLLSSVFLQKYKYVLDFKELIAYMKK